MEEDILGRGKCDWTPNYMGSVWSAQCYRRKTILLKTERLPDGCNSRSLPCSMFTISQYELQVLTLTPKASTVNQHPAPLNCEVISIYWENSCLFTRKIPRYEPFIIAKDEFLQAARLSLLAQGVEIDDRLLLWCGRNRQWAHIYLSNTFSLSTQIHSTWKL